MAELSYLQELRDIHLPHKVSIWPLAWGFWLLMIIIPLSMAIYHWLKPYWQAYLLKKVYLAKLQALVLNPEPTALTGIALLLKQAALINYPRAEVASLYGDKWLEFLNKSAKNIKLEHARILFSDALYQPAQNRDLKPAFELAKSWLKQQRFRTCMN